MNLFTKALLAFLALPGMVAIIIPGLWAFEDPARRFHMVGLIPLSIGMFGLLWCVRNIDGLPSHAAHRTKLS